MKDVAGDIVIVQDADLELNPNEYPELLGPIVKGGSNVVFGSRFLKWNSKPYSPTFFANKIFTFITNFLYGAGITNVMTCYKVFKEEIIENIKLKSSGFDIEPELTAKICKRGYKISEIPISCNPRCFKSGKKIKFSDSFKVIWAIIKYRFVN